MKINKDVIQSNDIEIIDFPNVLYKYMPEWPYAFSTLTTRFFHFSLISDFNDPFEGKFSDNEIYSKDEMREYFKNICHVPDDKMSSIENVMLHDTNWIETFKSKLMHEKESIEKEYGILCLSETNKNILMWSHYANSHKGIVIGLDPKIIWRTTTSSNIGGLIEPVKYEKDYPMVNYFKNQKGVIDKWFFTKYEEWEYEKEWRAIYKPGLTQFPKEIIQSVYFGAKFSPEKRDSWIKQIIDSGIKPEMYQASLDKTAYKINFEPINMQ